MTSGAREPTLAEVQAEFPQWRCAQGVGGLYCAQHDTTGTQVAGEDPVDLRDQIKAAQARLPVLPPPADDYREER